MMVIVDEVIHGIALNPVHHRNTFLCLHNTLRTPDSKVWST